jgi:hypothetical protein
MRVCVLRESTARYGSAAVRACYEHTVIVVHVRHDLCGLNRGQLIEFVRDKFGFLQSHRPMVIEITELGFRQDADPSFSPSLLCFTCLGCYIAL